MEKHEKRSEKAKKIEKIIKYKANRFLARYLYLILHK